MVSVTKAVLALGISLLLVFGIAAAFSIDNYFDDRIKALEQSAMLYDIRKNQLIDQRDSLHAINAMLLNELAMMKSDAENIAEQGSVQAQLQAQQQTDPVKKAEENAKIEALKLEQERLLQRQQEIKEKSQTPEVTSAS